MTTKTSPNAYVPKALQDVRDLIRHRQTGIDRVTIWIDAAAPDLPINRLSELSREALLASAQMRFQALWKSRLDLYQPTAKALKVLQRALGRKHATLISYIEIAFDFIAKDEHGARAIQDFLFGHLVVPNWRQRAKTNEYGTVYWGDRSKGPSSPDIQVAENLDDSADRSPNAGDSVTRRPKNLVIYADLPSKLPGPWRGRHCTHLEARLSGSNIIAQAAGIGSISDLIELDHRAFWGQSVDLMRVPSRTDLGRWLNPANTDVSGSALRKRAAQFMSKFEQRGIFVLQNALRQHRTLADVLEPIRHELIFGGNDDD